jgi:hypothetical protein
MPTTTHFSVSVSPAHQELFSAAGSATTAGVCVAGVAGVPGRFEGTVTQAGGMPTCPAGHVPPVWGTVAGGVVLVPPPSTGGAKQ